MMVPNIERSDDGNFERNYDDIVNVSMLSRCCIALVAEINAFSSWLLDNLFLMPD